MNFFYNHKLLARGGVKVDTAFNDVIKGDFIEKDGSFLLKSIEIVFYLAVFVETFRYQIGFGATGGLIGGTLTLLGLFTLFVCMSKKEVVPVSLFFIFGINIAATISQTLGNGQPPIVGDGLPELMHLFSFTIIVCYLARNRDTEIRMAIFLSIVVLLAIYLGGTEYIHYKRTRLALDGVGGGFKNANDLAYFSGLLACSLLFLSLLVPRKIRPILWAISFFLIFDCVRTVSRGGMLALTIGLGLFIMTVFKGRQKFFNVALLLILACSMTLFFMAQKFDYIDFIMERFDEQSYHKRLDVYQEDLLGDLLKTAYVGMGRTTAVTSSGISAHNSFIAVHMAYGGLTAYIYLTWMLYLLISVVKFALDRTQSPEYRLLTVTVLFMMYVGHLFSNNGYIFLSSIFATALIEKYTYGHRPRLMKHVLHRTTYN